MDIYTAHYRYSGDDRLDITVKGNTPPGNVLAPTWDMVKAHKAGTLGDWDYTVQYLSLIVKRMYSGAEIEQDMMDQIVFRLPSLTLVCFCPAGQFCHRIPAAQMLQNMGHGTYHGERIL